MCMYQTKADGSLVIPNKEPEKVELLHKIKTLTLNFEVPHLLFYFLMEAEEELFTAQGCGFRNWLESLKDEEKEELMTLEEMLRGKNEDERRNKTVVLELLKKFLEM